MTSLALQHKVPLIDVIRRLISMHFEPAGPTGNNGLPHATPLASYFESHLTDYLDPASRSELSLDC